MGTKTTRRRKSEKLTLAEHNAFIEWVRACDTKIDAAEELEVSTVTVDMVMLKGSGHPDTIAKIRAKIMAGTAA